MALTSNLGAINVRLNGRDNPRSRGVFHDPESLFIRDGFLIGNPFKYAGLDARKWRTAQINRYDESTHDGFGQDFAFTMLAEFQREGRLKHLASAVRLLNRTEAIASEHGQWVLKYLPLPKHMVLLVGNKPEADSELVAVYRGTRNFRACLNRLINNHITLDDLSGASQANESQRHAKYYANFRKMIESPDGDVQFEKLNNQLEAKIRYIMAIDEEAATRSANANKGILFKLILKFASAKTLDRLSGLIEAETADFNSKKEPTLPDFETMMAATAQTPEAAPETEVDSPANYFALVAINRGLINGNAQLNRIFGRSEENSLPLTFKFSSEARRQEVTKSPALMKGRLDILKLMVECAIDCRYNALKNSVNEIENTGQREQKNNFNPRAESLFLNTFWQALKECPKGLSHLEKKQHINDALTKLMTDLGAAKGNHAGMAELNNMLRKPDGRQ